MARRRTAAGSRYLPFAVLAVVGGLVIGLLLSRPLRQERPSLPSVAPATRPSPAREAPARAGRSGVQVVPVDEGAVDAAFRLGLAGLGEIVAETEVTRSEQRGDILLRWQARRIDLRTRRPAAQVLRSLEPGLRRAGGQVFSRGDLLTVGVIREGRRLVTHEVRLVRPPAVARVAVIFDDAGGSLEDIEAILGLERTVTVAVLPGLRFSSEVAERARAVGFEVILHLPLEADDPTKAMGPGGVTAAMSDDEIAATVRAGLASVPGAAGVNNHMGSKGTADERVMRAVLGEVKSRGLIWVDSVTSLRTAGTRLAGEMGIPTASRHVFLDNEDDPDAIRLQIRRLIDIARRQGEAIAIGHAHRQTAQVLREMVGEFDRLGIEFVPVSALAR